MATKKKTTEKTPVAPKEEKKLVQPGNLPTQQVFSDESERRKAERKEQQGDSAW